MKTCLAALTVLSLASTAYSQTLEPLPTMKMNTGIVIELISESKQFYLDILGFGVTFENDFCLLLHTPDSSAHISFLLPNHPSQQPLFQSKF